MPGTIIIIPFLLLIGLAVALRIQASLTDRAVAKVVGAFRDHHAEDVWTAQTREELGLAPRTLTERLARPLRDYKPIAVNILMGIRVVRMTGQKKLYLSEKDLVGVCSRSGNRMRICSAVRADSETR